MASSHFKRLVLVLGILAVASLVQVAFADEDGWTSEISPQSSPTQMTSNQ